jgi:O-antigen/teichoic acid export membrane protein/glycosyltransferase involved in cell wall biosynthesis
VTAAPPRSIQRGLALVFLSTAGSRLVSLVADVGLMRLLAPQDFGIVAFALVVTNAVSLLRAMGIGEALVANRDGSQATVNTAMVLTIGLGVVLFIGLAITAPGLVRWAGAEAPAQTTAVVRCIGLLVLLQSLTVVPAALIERELDFGKRFATDSLPTLVYAVAGLALAWGGWGVWSLVWGRLAGAAVGLVAVIWLSPWRPCWGFDLASARELLGYGRLVAAAGLVAFLVVNVDDVVVARCAGVESLGFYARAYLLANLPVTAMAHLANRVAFPAYARWRSDPEQVTNLYGRLFTAVLLLSLPAALLLAVLAQPLTTAVFGARWVPLVPVLQWLAPYGLLRAALSGTGPLFNALGRPGDAVGVNLLQLGLLAVLLIPSVTWWGAAGAGAAVLVATAASGPLAWRRASRLLAPSWPGHGRTVRPLLLPTAAAGVALTASAALLRLAGSGAWAELLGAGSAGLAAYGGVLRWRHPELLRQPLALVSGREPAVTAGPALAARTQRGVPMPAAGAALPEPPGLPWPAGVGDRAAGSGRTRVVVLETGGFGGIHHYAHGLVDALAAGGVPVTLLTTQRYELAGRPCRARCVRALRREWYPLTLARLAGLLRRERAGLLHVQSLVSPRKDLALLALCRLLRVKVLITAHNVLPHEVRRGERRLYRWYYRAAAAVIVHSHRNRAELLALEPDLDPARVGVIPHGNYAAFGDLELDRQEARRRLELPAAACIALFLGMIRPYKGLDLLLQTVPAVRQAVPASLFVVAGQAGPDEQDELQRRSAAMALSAADLVLRFGYLDLDQMVAYVNAADVVVLPYHAIAQSGVLLLAMSMGRAVVATRVGSFPETIDDGRTGWLVGAGDQAGLEARLAEVLAHPAQLAEAGRLARAAATTRYAWGPIAARTAALYRQLLTDPGPPCATSC